MCYNETEKLRRVWDKHMKQEFWLQIASADTVQRIPIVLCTDEKSDITVLYLDRNGKRIAVTGDSTENTLCRLNQILGDNWKIHSCYTCRYGHFCPLGDLDNEIFCITDFEPKSKEDLLKVTENPTERAKRLRTLFDVCADFQPCSEQYFTYK